MRIIKYKYLLNNKKFYNYIPILSNKDDNKKKIESEILQKLYNKGFINVRPIDAIIASNKEYCVYFKLITNNKLYKCMGLVTYYEINYNKHIIHFSSGDIYNDNDDNFKFNILYI
jgi:hypothetical protein